MYIIKLRFDSNVDRVYTYEEETATNLEFANMKYQRMLDKWFHILNGCGKNGATLHDVDDVIKKLNCEDNGKRAFKIEMIEVKDVLF